MPLCVPEGSLPPVVPVMFAFGCAVLFVVCSVWLIVALTGEGDADARAPVR